MELQFDISKSAIHLSNNGRAQDELLARNAHLEEMNNVLQSQNSFWEKENQKLKAQINELEAFLNELENESEIKSMIGKLFFYYEKS